MTRPIVLLELDGVPISRAAGSTVVESIVTKGNMLLQVGERSVVTTPSASSFPTYAGSTEGERVITVEHALKGPSAIDRDNARDFVKGLYDRKHGVRTLTFLRYGVEVYVQVVLQKLQPHPGGATMNAMIGTWYLLSSVYLTMTETSDTDSGSGALTVGMTGGNTRSRALRLELSAGAVRDPSDGHISGDPITIVNRSRRAFDRWAVDIRDDVVGSGSFGSWNSSVDGELADPVDGKDVEVWDVESGERLPHWFGPTGKGALGDTDTAVWCALDVPAGVEWVINNGASVGAGVTSIPVIGPMIALPATLPFYIAFVDDSGSTDHEVIRVTDVDRLDANRGTFTVERGVRGTTAQIIVDGSSLWWAQRELWMIVGDAGATAPTYIDDREAPMFTEGGPFRSHNGRYSWQRFMEAVAPDRPLDPLPRACSWRIGDMKEPDGLDHDRERTTAKGDMYTYVFPYTGVAGNSDASPSTALALSYKKTIERRFASRWEIELPVRVDDITYTESTGLLTYGGTDPNEGRLRVWGEAADGSLILIYQTDGTNLVAHNDVPVVPINLLAFSWQPFDPKLDDYQNDVAQQPDDGDAIIITDVTLDVLDADAIVAIQGGRYDIYQFGRPDDDDGPLTIVDEDGNTLEIRGLIVTIDEVITIDCDRRTVVSETGHSRAAFVRGDFPMVLEDDGGGDRSIVATDSRTPGSWDIALYGRGGYN